MTITKRRISIPPSAISLHGPEFASFARPSASLWISLGISDELGDRLGRNRLMHHHDVGHDNDAGDRRDVANEIETKLFVQRSIDCVGRGDQEERVAIGGRTHDRLGGDITAGTRPVLDDEWLSNRSHPEITGKILGISL
jgi:hypothetical protein